MDRSGLRFPGVGNLCAEAPLLRLGRRGPGPRDPTSSWSSYWLPGLYQMGHWAGNSNLLTTLAKNASLPTEILVLPPPPAARAEA